jgi:tripartite-type tricarboxylate transporter receptor subunit TctC
MKFKLAVALLFALTCSAAAATYPSRTITMIIGIGTVGTHAQNQWLYDHPAYNR